MIKKTAKQIAKAVAQEPIEILKDAKEQVTSSSSQETAAKEEPKEEKPKVDVQKLQNQSIRQIQALEAEIKDISLQRQQKEQQTKQEVVPPPATQEAPPSISSKPQRGKLRGMKQKLSDLTNRTETRKQSSG